MHHVFLIELFIWIQKICNHHEESLINLFRARLKCCSEQKNHTAVGCTFQRSRFGVKTKQRQCSVWIPENVNAVQSPKCSACIHASTLRLSDWTEGYHMPRNCNYNAINDLPRDEMKKFINQSQKCNANKGHLDDYILKTN